MDVVLKLFGQDVHWITNVESIVIRHGKLFIIYTNYEIKSDGELVEKIVPITQVEHFHS